ncbi:MAG: hypothetical protein Q9227_004933 [Pyrenula ochraceoflavens]
MTTVIAVPAFYNSPEAAWWAPIAIFIGGAIPFGFVMYTTYPIVMWIRLVLPNHARTSHAAAQHYAENLPPNARLLIFFMRFTTFRGMAEVCAADLAPAQKELLRPVTFKVVDPCYARGAFWHPNPWRFYTRDIDGIGRDTPRTVEGMWGRVLKNLVK